MAGAGDKSFAEVTALSRAEWSEWLRDHHATSESVWLVYRKQSKGGQLTVDEAVEEALCWGWIDSLPRKRDDDFTMLLFSPRRANSNWSAVNKARVERAISSGRMQPQGLAVINEAKANGRWQALDDVEALVIPADLGDALDALPPARINFEAFPKSARRGILEWILNARTVETRAKRIAETAKLAADNIRANQWKGGRG
ncbi:YdeI/OmpD-associated family protein [Peteryoungia desertarenae]|uniref:YdeI/OmpD-associated family protein n=1 Tax=Peteryoungia desertarenae TaxID=1813451 RepID=A0ABX6QMV2_9HYPH|nr:YdeI/OmpD-associated family protein [Peteryoungia desertarenae]QLF69904.1 YdeI/OmpD-associated family protein [Peteryoungia desertarenae]